METVHEILNTPTF